MNNVSNMPRKLREYVNNALYNAELYRILAKSAPTEGDKNTLEKFADENRQTADAFMAIYHSMTGYSCEPEPSPIKESGSYKTVLRSRIKIEIADSQCYRREYMNISDNFKLKRAFFSAYNEALCRCIMIIDLIM